MVGKCNIRVKICNITEHGEMWKIVIFAYRSCVFIGAFLRIGMS